MLIKNFHDSISEGDAEGLLIQWKCLMLLFKADDTSSNGYALELLYLMFQYYALLSPREAERLIWNRFQKTKSGLQGHFSLDMALEHYNALLKTSLRHMEPNNTN